MTIRAVTDIKHSDGYIAAGEEVTGLDDDTMCDLVEAGALESDDEEELDEYRDLVDKRDINKDAEDPDAYLEGQEPSEVDFYADRQEEQDAKRAEAVKDRGQPTEEVTAPGA